MTLLTGYLPVEEGVAAWASLDRHASAAKASGDERTRAQIMADALAERLTGQAKATDVGVEVRVTVPADTFTGDDEEPGDVEGYGPTPADIVRDVLGFDSSGQSDDESAGASRGDDEHATATMSADVRGTGDVFARGATIDPDSDTVRDLGARRRRFTAADARLIRARDQVCRTPGCGAPIRHFDHIRPYRADGPTTVGNGQGLCERCSYVKETPGWRTQVLSIGGAGGPPHTTVITTPTGHTYQSQAPPAIGYGPGERTLRTVRQQRRLERLMVRQRPPT